MITQESIGAVSSNIESKTAFQIKANAKAFRLLSSNLYSDKPLAIVREIGCNALDSHIAAGCPEKPFKVVLPTSSYMFLEITDYGVGLDDEEVRSIFSTFFESTKTTSNDLIGAMGLGSKSPFAYTDAYEVYTRKNGIAGTYACFLNADGAPEIYNLNSRPYEGDEVDGVTVRVPIKASDIRLFHIAARNAYRFFDVKPIINEIELAPVEYKFEGSTFKLMTGAQAHYALMGPVAYPIDISKLDLNHQRFLNDLRSKLQLFLVLNSPMGSLDVNAGREGLSYDQTTIDNLNKQIDGIHEEISKSYQTQIDACKTLYEASSLRYAIDRQQFYTLKFNNKDVPLTLLYNTDAKYIVDSDYIVKYRKYNHSKTLVSGGLTIIVAPSSKTRVILVDDRKIYVKKMIYADTEIGTNVRFVLTSEIGNTGKAAFAKLVKQFDADGVPWEWMSDIKYTLPVATKSEKGKLDTKTTRGKTKGVFKYGSSFAKYDMEPFNINSSDDIVYVYYTPRTGEMVLNGVHKKWSSLPYQIRANLINSIRADKKELVVITPLAAQDLTIPSKWVHVDEYIKKMFVNECSKNEFRNVCGKFIGGIPYLAQSEADDIVNNKTTDPVFKTIITGIRSIQFTSSSVTDTEFRMFFSDVYGLVTSYGPSGCDWGKVERLLFDHFDIIKTWNGRYYSTYNYTQIKDIVLLFSLMLKHGTIDRKEIEALIK